DLRLDTEEGAYAALKDSKRQHAIVPGNLASIVVYHRLISDDPDLKMPPPSSNLSLSPREIATLVRWIEQGAEYKPHWAFIAPVKPQLPPETPGSRAQSPVDRFILQRLEREGLKPSPEAAREDLVRRASFDLTGLPPSLEETERFLADKSGDAYEKMIDRL